jgi:hypothetical protein
LSYQESRKSDGGWKKRGKTGWVLARKAKELPLLALVPLASTGLPPIKVVGIGEGAVAVADLIAQRARDGGEELQPRRRSIQRERNGKLLKGKRGGLSLPFSFFPFHFLFSRMHV